MSTSASSVSGTNEANTAGTGVVLLVIAALACCGFTANALELSGPSSPGVSFMYGSIAVMVAAAVMGPVSACVVAVITALPTLEAWGHGWALAIFALEGLVCGALLHSSSRNQRKRALSLTLSAVFFWAVAGIPLAYFAYAQALGVPAPSVKLIVPKLALNGVFNAALAEFIVFLLVAPNFGGWLRRQGLKIYRWRIRDMYVASIVVTTLCLVLLNVVAASNANFARQYGLQRQNQESTLTMFNSVLSSQTTQGSSVVDAQTLEDMLNAISPRYALSIRRGGERKTFGSFPAEITEEGPAFEASGLDSREAQHMSGWLEGYMVVRQPGNDDGSVMVLVSRLGPLIDQLWQDTADALVTSVVYVALVILFALLFSRYVTQSLTSLADRSALMRSTPLSHGAQVAGFTQAQGFEPEETHNLRIAIATALEEEARLNQAALTAAGDYQKIIEVANAPIVVIDMTGVIIGWNEAAERVTGQGREVALGKRTEEVLIDQIPRVDTDRIISRLRGGGSLEGLRLSFKNTDGRRITLLLSGVVLTDVNGEPDRLIMVGQNLTDYLEQEQQLLQASKMTTLGEMATGVAHELNQPLNAMRLSLANIKRVISQQPGGVDAVEDKLLRIDGQIDRATKIIDHLRLYGRRAEASADSSSAIFLPDEVVEMASSLFQEQFRLSNISFQCDLDGAEALVGGDGMLFEQVLINLLSNARDAIRSQNADKTTGTITIASTRRGQAYELVVEDSGGGADQYQIDHLFEPFFTTKPPGQGTGLGLSIAYSTISNMGGSIGANNGEAGLRITINLPVLANHSIPAAH